MTLKKTVKSDYFRRIILDEVNSTNEYAAKYHGAAEIPVCITAEYQTGGKGQPGNSWFSKKGKNLLVSYLIQPGSLSALVSFYLSKVTALSVAESLEKKIPGIAIKWPNDILVKHKKIGGILIENTLLGSMISKSIIGIGLNVNQDIFPENITDPLPTSLKIESGSFCDREELLSEISSNLEYWLGELDEENFQAIDRKYFEKLFGFQQWHVYSDESSIFEARIIGVKEEGPLILETREGEKHEFSFREIKLKLP